MVKLLLLGLVQVLQLDLVEEMVDVTHHKLEVETHLTIKVVVEVVQLNLVVVLEVQEL